MTSSPTPDRLGMSGAGDTRHLHTVPPVPPTPEPLGRDAVIAVAYLTGYGIGVTIDYVFNSMLALCRRVSI